MMRVALSMATLAALALAFASASFAQAAAEPPVAATPAPPAKAAAHGKRQTLQQRFDAANASHDGRLTQAQAEAAKWGYVTKHFSAMDKDHKGYVTVDDIHGLSHALHAAQHPAAAAKPAPATSTN